MHKASVYKQWDKGQQNCDLRKWSGSVGKESLNNDD